MNTATITACPTCAKPLAGRGKCRSYVHRALGPQKVGGVYRYDKWSQPFTVTAIREVVSDWRGWAITCQDADGRIREHCTPWKDREGIVVSQPDS